MNLRKPHAAAGPSGTPMCRMYASVGPRGPPAEELLAFRGLCERGCGGPHGDGWGVVGYREPGAPHTLGKSVEAAIKDKAFEGAAAQAPAFGLVVAHLRKASVGPKTLDNTHPFTLGPWTFCHNGTIGGGYAQRLGTGGMNDSRTFFARVHEHLGAGADPVKALRSAVREVRDRDFPYTSITVLLSDGARLYGLREVREDPGDYELHWQRRDGRIVLCQEPVLAGAWEAVPNGHIAVVERGRVEVVSL